MDFVYSELSRAFFIFASNFFICFIGELKARKISQTHINIAIYIKTIDHNPRLSVVKNKVISSGVANFDLIFENHWIAIYVD